MTTCHTHLIFDMCINSTTIFSIKVDLVLYNWKIFKFQLFRGKISFVTLKGIVGQLFPKHCSRVFYVKIYPPVVT